MEVFIPNVFSPNGDDQNDVFFVLGGRDVALVEIMQVFDRWGSLVFNANNVPPNDRQYGWTGNAHGLQMDSGVFVYRIRIRFVNGRTMEFTGGVTLVR